MSDVDPSDALVRYYAARAPVYDKTAGFTEPETQRIHRAIRNRYRALFAGHRVLDVACGTGYWTAVVGGVAKATLGIDANPAVLAQAEARCRHLPSVGFQVADAFTMEGVPRGFDAVLGVWWWSHVPKARLSSFLEVLHGRLVPGAMVLFVDQLPGERIERRDEDGNTFVRRSLPDGQSFEIVKNHPTEAEVRRALSNLGERVRYRVRQVEESWSVEYRVLEGAHPPA